MDSKSLKSEVDAFIATCEQRGFPISEYCLNEAYPGDSSTSYFFDLKANWIQDDQCFEAINFFTDVMFDVMSVEARRKIFSIRVFTKEDEIHCDSGQIIHVVNKSA